MGGRVAAGLPGRAGSRLCSGQWGRGWRDGPPQHTNSPMIADAVLTGAVKEGVQPGWNQCWGGQRGSLYVGTTMLGRMRHG